MAREIEISTAADVLAVTDEISRQLRLGKIPRVRISVPRDQKTARQRKYFYGGIIRGALKYEALEGVDVDSLVDALLTEASTGVLRFGNVDIPKIKRISTMNTEEMSHLIKISLHWLSLNFGIYILIPKEYYKKQGWEYDETIDR